MPSLKYALLLLPDCSTHDTRELDFGDGVHTFVSSLPELIAGENLVHWKEWVGSSKWTQISSPSRCVAVTCPAEQPGVLSHDNVALTKRLTRSIHALNFTRYNRRPWGPLFMFTGDATGPRSYRDLRSFAEHEVRIQPIYEARREWTDSFDWNQDLWLEEWRDADAFIGPDPRPPLLNYGLSSLAHAMCEGQMEFRLPELVRAAETILAIPKGPGASVFTKRAHCVAPNLGSAPLLAGCDIDVMLNEVFDLRSACVHGKMPFEELAATGAEGEHRLAQLEFVAHEVACAALRVALENRGPYFNSRGELESAWKDAKFPPKQQTINPV